MWKETLGTEAGFHLIEGVRLIWGPLNTGFAVFGLFSIIKDLNIITMPIVCIELKKTDCKRVLRIV